MCNNMRRCVNTVISRNALWRTVKDRLVAADGLGCLALELVQHSAHSAGIRVQSHSIDCTGISTE